MIKNDKRNNRNFDLQGWLNTVLSILVVFRSQLDKIIEAKKNMAGEANAKVAFSQGKDAMDAVSNLEKINTTLFNAIEEIKKLLNQRTLTLTQQKPEVALSKEDAIKS